MFGCLQIVADGWVSDAIARVGSSAESGLTEAQLSDELGSRELPPGLMNASKTISWWQQRQMAFQRAAQERRFKLKKNLEKLNKTARKTIRESNRSLPKLLSRGRTTG